MKQCDTCGIQLDTSEWSAIAKAQKGYCWECFQLQIVEHGGQLRRCKHCYEMLTDQWATKRPADHNIFQCDRCRASARRKKHLMSS